MNDKLVRAINDLVEEYIEYDILYQEPLEVRNNNANSTSIVITVLHNGKPNKEGKMVEQPITLLNERELEVYNNLPNDFSRKEFVNCFRKIGKSNTLCYQLFNMLKSNGYIYLDGYTQNYRRVYVRQNNNLKYGEFDMFEKNNELAIRVLGAMNQKRFKSFHFYDYLRTYVSEDWKEYKATNLLKFYKKNGLVEYRGRGDYVVTGRLFN